MKSVLSMFVFAALVPLTACAENSTESKDEPIKLGHWKDARKICTDKEEEKHVAGDYSCVVGNPKVPWRIIIKSTAEDLGCSSNQLAKVSGLIDVLDEKMGDEAYLLTCSSDVADAIRSLLRDGTN